MAVFFIDTSSGEVATKRQLVEAGITDGLAAAPPRPWLRIQGTDDATTMWYGVFRKQVKDVFIGALALRHSDHHASLLAAGYEEVAVEELRRRGPSEAPDQAM
jgi:hypothetical protein